MSKKFKVIILLIVIMVIAYWASLHIRSAMVLSDGEEFAVDVLKDISDDNWSVDSIRKHSSEWLLYSMDTDPEVFSDYMRINVGRIHEVSLRGECDFQGVDLKGKSGVYVWGVCPIKVHSQGGTSSFDIKILWNGDSRVWFLYALRNGVFIR